MHRSTENTFEVTPDQVAVIELAASRRKKGEQRLQPVRVSEKLIETTSHWRDDGPRWEYEVRVFGLYLRKDGSVGQMRETLTFSAPSAAWNGQSIEHLPADIAKLCVGIDGLREWKLDLETANG